MMTWLHITGLVLSCLHLALGKASEYQLDSENLSQCESLRNMAVARQRDTIPHCVADGRFKGVQCASGGQDCWCVNAEGQEILGTRTNNSALHCPTPCQLQRQQVLAAAGGDVVPRCQVSGEYEPVQCDVSLGQCWCVDLGGMELYGSRQEGRPAHCPSSCEVRVRRLLHTSGHSPPQCSDDGSFLPVQCKFINTTERTELDLLTSYNRFPESFETFSSFRRTFPLVSSYCYCSDSRGRELPSTGVELLLSEVYDTAFSGLGSGRSFSQSNVYRVLQRRLLGLRLAMTGHFRCPTDCEMERGAAQQASSVFVPSCDSSGDFLPQQCQMGGQCWCVDASGREVPATRQQGDAFICTAAITDCPSQRRLALSRLLSGPMEPPRLASPCSPELQPLRQLLLDQQPSFPAQMSEVLHGLFPSLGLALQALSFSTPNRLQENLFGGKFLKNAASFNFSGAVGDEGTRSFRRTFSQLGLSLDRDGLLLLAQNLSSPLPEHLDQNISDDFGSSTNLLQNQQLILLVSKTLADPVFLSTLKHTLLYLSNSDSAASLQQVLTPMLQSCASEAAAMFVPRCTASGQYQELQCGDAQCWCVDPKGQEVEGSRVTGQRPRCPSHCETERALALRMKGSMAAGSELYIPACSEDGSFLPLQCVATRCFCVNDDGNVTPTLTTEGANICSVGDMEILPVSSAPPCSQALAKITAFQQEAQKIISLSNSSHLPLGYGFLLAKGLRLTQEELQASQSAEEEQISDRLLSRFQSGLRLAAYSTLQFYWRGQQRGPQRLVYLPYTPQCDADGYWLPTQCHLSTGRCWCVDEDGGHVSGSLVVHSQRLPSCLSGCQRSFAHTLVSGWTKGSDITFSSQCDERGQFQALQMDGAAGWCVSPLTGERVQSATQGPGGQFTCPSWCLIGSLIGGRGFQCLEDGTFSPLHCDITSCWCVSENGQEVPQTRMLRSTGTPPSCDRPLCPEPSVTHGALLCHSVARGRQNCDLTCYHGYQNALPVSSFLCDVERQKWETDAPLVGACQRSQPFQTVMSSVEFLLSLSEDQTCSPLLSHLPNQILSNMATRGLCSLQLPASSTMVSLCDDSSVHLQCDSGDVMRLKVKWEAALSDLPTSDFPNLHDLDVLLNETSFLAGLQGLLGSYHFVSSSEPQLVSMALPRFGCSHGYHPDTEGTGCMVCPAGSFSKEGECRPCAQGTYQDEEGRDFCNKCTKGTTAIGASSVSQCVTECQRRDLRCSDSGDFLSAQHDFLSGHWRCVTTEGEELEWTNSNAPLSDEACTVLMGFEAVPGSDLTEAEDTETLLSQTSNLQACLQACAVETSCQHVLLFTEEGQIHCDLYSTHTHCNTTQQARGFLGNAQAELFDRLNCSLGVRGGASDRLVIRKKGHEFLTHLQNGFERLTFRKADSGVFRTLVFPSEGTFLSDVHRFCQDQCSRDACCDGFILNQNILNGGSFLCGLMRAPSVLLCADQDWDMTGQGKANRVCGAGLIYNKQQRSFIFNFGGQEFTITDSSLPANSKNKTDYQASIIGFQAIYLQTGADGESSSSSSSSCPVEQSSPALDDSNSLVVHRVFESLSADSVLVDPLMRQLPGLSFLLNKQHYNSQEALLWCLTRCVSEQQCLLVDVRGGSGGFLTCELLPDSRVCGSYSSPLTPPCRHLLATTPHNAFIKKVDVSGPVKSFYRRVSFQKMVSYSVRSRTSLGQHAPLSEGFLECERRCDEDSCCRGFGFVRDTRTPDRTDIVCLSLISMGVQTCSEDDETRWRSQDCRPSAVKTSPLPFGWYQKPVNQWTKSPALCPPFSLPVPTNVSLDQWNVLHASSLLVDPFLSSYDVIHVSQDIAGDREKTRDWCLSACEEAESCLALSISQTESAVRCVLYPDTRACGPSPAHSPTSTSSSCRLVIKEPASQVYLKKERLPLVTSVLIPGHGALQGISMDTMLGTDRKSVIQYLGVPYARPPIGLLRFRPPQPADWRGTWNASKPRPSCIQPGDVESPASDEDCLYLNIFIPTGLTGPVPVLVFFFNPSANQSSGLLDGSALSAVGSIVVVTASYRTAAFGFLTTGSSSLPGNYGLADQVAVLRWVNAHITLMGGDNKRLTVGAERRGADITSLLSPSFVLPRPAPLFQRMLLMGGSMFSPSLVQSVSSAKQQTVQLARELGCLTSDLNESNMTACLRLIPAHTLNAAQTKLLSVTGPLQAWSPVPDDVLVSKSDSNPATFHTVDLLLGTSAQDGLISRARRIKDFEALQGRTDGKTAFYEALSNSLGGERNSSLLKEAASWFYSFQHSPSPAGYNLFSHALNNATRDLFIVCPSLQMASHWASSKANAFLYHLPETSSQNRADVLVPLDVQLAFGIPHDPISSPRFTSTEQRLSLAMMTYTSNFIKTGDPNQPRGLVPEVTLPVWTPVQPLPILPSYKELEPKLLQRQGLRQPECSFWNQFIPKLTGHTEPFQSPSTNKPQTEKDAYS